MGSMLDEILEAIGPEALGPGGLAAGRTDPVAREDVRRWAISDDMETLGALVSLLDSPEFRTRVQPPLSFDEHQALFLRYTERCFLENSAGDWADSRYSAGWALVGWFIALWRKEAVPRKKLLEIKRMLARLYKSGNSEVRVCIVNATLEHLFEDRGVAKYFKDWKEDPVLAQAYADAMLWSDNGGTSPLTERQ